MSTIQAHRYHDISTGHRVYQHESKCAHLHGHNYRVHFYIDAPKLDGIGRVLDFSVIKEKLCMWLEANWDHKFLVFSADPWAQELKKLDPEGVVLVEFNPTAENMAEYLMLNVGPKQLDGTAASLAKVVIEETRKCGVTVQGSTKIIAPAGTILDTRA